MILLLLTILAIIFVICLQIHFFLKNWKNINKLGRIFSDEKKWGITFSYSMEDGEYYLISEEGSENHYKQTARAINAYLKSSSASVVDANSIRDIVDRKCDSLENEIEALLPFPLYCGLAGTMIGIILGLLDLLLSEDITSLLDGSATTGGALGSGITSLLSGVVFAMFASFIGISLTTLNSNAYKKSKKALDLGKADFLAWLQRRLMPKLPMSMSSVFSNLTEGLNEFNETFRENTEGLGDMLCEINNSYSNQADILEAVQNLDVVQMSKANVKVWKELQESTYKIEQFNKYLSEIQGYTETIHKFETLFARETERIHILEEIRDFFSSYKGSIAKTTADADDTIQRALQSIEESTSQAVKNLQESFQRQCQSIQDTATSQADTFRETSKSVQSAFRSELELMPQLAKQLEDIASIPTALSSTADRIEASNKQLAEAISTSFQKAVQGIGQKKSTPRSRTAGQAGANPKPESRKAPLGSPSLNATNRSQANKPSGAPVPQKATQIPYRTEETIPIPKPPRKKTLIPRIFRAKR